MTRTGSATRTALALLVALGGTATGLHAQDLRGSLVTTVRYFEIRPLTRDTVAETRVTPRPGGGFQFEGQAVTCLPTGGCVFTRSGDREHALHFTQDLTFTAWGLGVRGLSTTVYLRSRADVSGGFVWPRSDDAFDAILGYAELNRDSYRIRLGRQRTLSGLGFSGFDGLSALVEPVPGLRAEAYGGRSLARGLAEPRNTALAGVESFLPDRDAYLIGGAVSAEPLAGTNVELRYQREIWSNRSALLSERASLDLRTSGLRPLRIDGSLDYDFAFARVGKAHLTVNVPVSGLGLAVKATGRRYVPYFELWTIWGLFDPVGYQEAELQAAWYAPGTSHRVWAAGAYRTYEDANASIFLQPLRDDGWRVGGGASVAAANAVSVVGSYWREWGFGAAISEADLRVQWRPHDRLGVTFNGGVFQQIQEFRVGEGTVFATGTSLDLDITRMIRFRGGVDIYQQDFDGKPTTVDWDQVRAWSTLQLRFGKDAGR